MRAMGLGLRAASAAVVVATVAIGTGCEGVLGVLPPTAELSRVDLVSAPTESELLDYALDLPGAPAKKDLVYSFDLVFDLENPNLNVPIPLVELLLGIEVLDATNLGAVCVSFCDPDDADCVPAINAEGACEADGSRDVSEPGDLVPTVDDLVALAETASAGELDNGDWKTIPPGELMEAHIQFDLGVDPMLDITGQLLDQAASDFLAGRNVSFDIPYVAEGSVFFEAPQLDRYALGFGPFEDEWELR
jgi:hypothetical protein